MALLDTAPNERESVEASPLSPVSHAVSPVTDSTRFMISRELSPGRATTTTISARNGRQRLRAQTYSPGRYVGIIETPSTTIRRMTGRSNAARARTSMVANLKHNNASADLVDISWKGRLMNVFQRITAAFDGTATAVSAHCDLPCGVYDPAQAKLEAQSVKACMEKYAASSDADFKVRATGIKEERAELVKHHLWVLWTDYFKPEHLEAHPTLHDLFWKATKSAGEAKKTNDVAVADRLLSEIDAIAEIFWATKK